MIEVIIMIMMAEDIRGKDHDSGHHRGGHSHDRGSHGHDSGGNGGHDGGGHSGCRGGGVVEAVDLIHFM